MTCRICKEIIPPKELKHVDFCPFCGHVNGEVEIIGHEAGEVAIKINKTNTAATSLKLENNYAAKIRAEVRLEDDVKGCYSLIFSDDGDGGCDVAPGAPINIGLKASFSPDFNDGSSYDNVRLVIDTYDKAEDSKRGEALYQKQTHSLRLIPVFAKSGRLVLDREFLVFTANNAQETLIISNTGDEPIDIVDIKCPSGFSVDGIAPDDTISKEGSVSAKISFNLSRFDNDICEELEITYRVLGIEDSIDAVLFAAKKISMFSGPRLPDNYIAIDFGTSKTAAAYMSLDEIFPGGVLTPVIHMIKLDEANNQYDIPSTIALEGADYKIGKFAKVDMSIPRAENIKMHLRNKTISLKRFNKTLQDNTMEKDTATVLREYMKQLNGLLPASLRNKNNHFIFTLPVLDLEGGSNLFRNQEDMVKNSAVGSGIAREGWIKTMLEPDAAMIYMLNSIKENRPDIALAKGDTICIFDFGAGTLDVLFGNYIIKEGGIPSIDALFTMGMFRIDGKDNVTYGGTNIDEELGLALIMENGYGSDNGLVLVEDDPAYDEDGNLFGIRDFRRFGFESGDPANRFYLGLHKHQYESHFVKSAKEWHCFPHDTPLIADGTSPYTLDVPPITDSDFFTCGEGTLNGIVANGLKGVLENVEMKMKAMSVSEPSLVLMIGGSSLLKQAGEALRKAFPGSNVLGPHDLYSESLPLDNISDRIKLREEAVFPVVKGALLSEIVRHEDLFSYGLEVADTKDSSNVLWRFDKKDSYPSERDVSSELKAGYHRKPGYDLEKEWGIYALPGNGKRYKMASLQLPEDVTASPNVVLYISVASGTRKLQMHYSVQGIKQPISIPDIFV